MPDISTVHLDQFLTNVSIGYQNATFYGRQLFPIVPVSRQTNKYPIFGKERFKLYDDSRRPGAEAIERPSWRLSNDVYFCDGHAQKEAIPDELKANSDVPDIEIQSTEDLTDAIWLRHEKVVFDVIFGAGSAVPNTTLSGTSQWSDYVNSDPVVAVENQKSAIFKNIAKVPNTLLVSYPVFLALRSHPKILDRFKYTQTAVLMPDHLRSAFDVELGYTFIWLYDGGANQGFLVKRYREEKRTADIIEVQVYYDPKVVVATAAYAWINAVV
ncbi:MAG: hypothetical protein DMG23_11835 [Acidobacteria bacterium]|nr:MAG: hypothetical protein DMG23_11835 [Acidobacteriota bacterium]